MVDELIKAKLFGTKCQWCGRVFKPTSKRGIVPKFCNNAHKQAAYRATRNAEDIETVSRSRPISRRCPACGSLKTLVGISIKSACKNCGHRWYISGTDQHQGVTTNDKQK